MNGLNHKFLAYGRLALVILIPIFILYLADGRACRAGGFDYHAGIQDPLGDAFGALPQHDAVHFDLYLDYNSLYIVGQFSAPIYPPGSGANQLLGFIDLDVDHNPATGSASNVSNYLGYPQCGNSGLGIEYYVDIATWVNG